jgi:hypothetical protein
VAIAGGMTLPRCAHGQDVLVTGTTHAQYVMLRRLVEDSVAVEDAPGDGLLRRATNGHIVRCVTGERFCRYMRSADRVSAVPLMQDITVSAWGYTPGLRAYAHLRARAEIGDGPALWPRADDNFDAIAAYIELDRGGLRVRAGRQWRTSGLGFHTFDGASILVRTIEPFIFEAYGGWSLLRGVSEPHTSGSLAAVEPFAPDARAVLLGATVAYRPTSRMAAAATYQREIRSDRLGLYAERLALDASLRADRFTVNASLEGDVATRTVNEAKLQAHRALRPDLGVRVYARRYRPFFELWTIWGAFAPVGFTELGLAGAWTPAGRPFTLDVDVSRRGYADTDASTTFGSARATGWRTGAGSTLQLASWLLSGHYGLDIGVGAARSDLSVRMQRDIGGDGYVAASATAFQRQYEFRVSEGVVLGLTADGGVRVASRVHVAGSLGVYRHTSTASTPDVDWSQVRGSLRLEWSLGSDPDALAQRLGATGSGSR